MQEQVSPLCNPINVNAIQQLVIMYRKVMQLWVVFLVGRKLLAKRRQRSSVPWWSSTPHLE
jgi:hypothetical protein